MRLALPVLTALALAGAALAQTPAVTIEDDVAPENALKCAAVRMTQVDIGTRGGGASPAMVAAVDAWLKSGVDPAKAKAEAQKLRTTPMPEIAALGEACAPFEIKAAPRAGG